MEGHLDFAPLLIVLAMAFAVPLLLARVRWLPVVVGELLAGVLIGTSGFGWVHQEPLLDIFSNIGLAFLMFLAGLEIDFDRLFPSAKPGQQHRPKSNPILPLSAGVYVLTLALAVPAGFGLNAIGLESDPWMLAFILSATSLGVLLPILKQREMSGTKTGQAILSLLRQINREEGCTIVMVTHSQEAASYGDRTIFVRDGRIEKESP